VYSTDLMRQLCREITAEKDPHRVEELISLLRAVIRDDHAEIRTRMGFLAKEYAGVISKSDAAD
jgi:cytochrome c-type biogenesis protein CcmH/NrfG